MGDDWEASAAAWLDEQGEFGDFGRVHVMDGPMQSRVVAAGPVNAVDIGCGEGRFCRWMRSQGIAAIGVDPTYALLDAARERDPEGDYRQGVAEALPLEDASVDLAVSYLSMIDIADFRAAFAESHRVLRPGARFLIANLQPYLTAAETWSRDETGAASLQIVRYFDEHWRWAEWRDMRVRNWHRPMKAYMQALLGLGFQLTWFDEPKPTGGPERQQRKYGAAPYFYAMEWQKPG